MLKKYSFPIILLLVTGFFIGKYLYMQPKFINGEIAPSFTAQTLKGETFSLAGLKGNYVLIDFWGTWCGPCRTEIPEVKKLYATYYGKVFRDASNFEIVSIALEKAGSEAHWEKAVRSLGMDWNYHIFDGVTNFKFLDAKIASQTYGVKEVPTKYLLNPEGYIMGVNLPFEEIHKLLDGRLK